MRDVRLVFRQLRQTPLFFCAAVGTLAIGTAATTAIFSTVNATLLRPLPYPHSERLLHVRTKAGGFVTTGLLSGVEIEALTDVHDLVSGAAGFAPQPFDATLVRADGTPVPVSAAGVTDGFFEVTGLPMTAGRGFTHAEHAPMKGNVPPLLVVSYSAWKTLLGGDPDIINKTVRLAEIPVGITVVGVAAPGLELPRGTDFWFNMRLAPQEINHNYDTVLRLRSGATIEALRSVAATKMSGLAQRFPSDVGREYVIRPLVADMVGDLRNTLLIVLGATLLLLVLAAVNVTNLLLARGTARSREIAVRSALGASRGRVVRQMLAESAVIATAGTVLGVFLAFGAVRLMLALGASKLPRLETVPFDARVLLFAVAVLACSVIIMGVAPAWRLSGVDIRTLLNESGRSASSSRGTSRTMGGLIVAEVALALALVAGAGWLVQSFSRLRATDPGFTAAGRLVVDVRATRGFRQPAPAHAWETGVVDSIRSAAVNAQVGEAATFPLRIDRDGTLLIHVDGQPQDPANMKGARIRSAGTGFFEAMGVKLVAGRLISAADRLDTEHVAVVNEAFVRTFFPDGQPLNRTFAFGYPHIDPATATRIVGVVGDVRYKSLTETPEPACYLAAAQQPVPPMRPAVVVHPYDGNVDALISPLRAAVARFDPQAIVEFEPASAIVGRTLDRQELGMTLMLIFGAAALTLAALGIYGVIAYAAAQRRGEIATRIALGASRWDVFRLMMGSGQKLAAMGLLAGVGLAYAGGRSVASSVFGMRASDPVVLTGACLAVAAVTLAATAIPAVRACRLDPSRALRPE